MWDYFFTAVALLLVMEGILPFSSPEQYRKMLLNIAQSSDKAMRISGFALMIAGVAIMYVVHAIF